MFTPELSPTADAIPAQEPAEFEFVLGRRQVASVSLVALTALAIFTTAAYMVGKGTVPAPVPVPVAVPVKSAPVAVPPPAAKPAQLPEAPLFGDAEKKGLYIQLGSVERGFAVMMVHGARKVGYPAFAAKGTNPNVFRVLVGPFTDKPQYETAKGTFSSMGLDTFSRSYSASSDSKSATPEP